jgi:hypothetical protein
MLKLSHVLIIFFIIFAQLPSLSSSQSPPHAVAPAASLSVDSILPLGAIVIGVAYGIIQAYGMSKEKANAIVYASFEKRLQESENRLQECEKRRELESVAFEKRHDECEKYRDIERKQRDEYRDALSNANARIAQLEARYEGGSHAPS